MKQSEIEYLLVEAKKCQGLVKEFYPEFEYRSYSSNIFTNRKNNEPLEKPYGRIIDFLEGESSSYDELDDYDALSDLIMACSLASRKVLEVKVDASEIISSLEEMKEIADYYSGKKREYLQDSAVSASKYISNLISEAKKIAGGLFWQAESYSGRISIEALAADLFRGKIYDESEIEDALKEHEKAGKQDDTEKPDRAMYFEKEDDSENQCEKKARDQYPGACEILKMHSKRLVIESKKASGNIFEKIFYSILYPW